MGLLKAIEEFNQSRNELITRINNLQEAVEQITNPENRGYMAALTDMLTAAVEEHKRSSDELLDIIDECIKIKD